MRIARVQLPEIDLISPKFHRTWARYVLKAGIGRLGPMVIEIAIDHYDRLLAHCDRASRDYAILKNGLVVRRPKDGKYERIVEIFGEMQDAQLLLALAHKICPAAAPAITKAMSLARGV